MQETGISDSESSTGLSRIALYLSSIRIWESLFALPFAFIGMALASQSVNGSPWPGWSAFIWINVAMFGARTLGMAANRLVHARKTRPIPALGTATCRPAS